MNLVEFEAKALLRNAGLPVPPGAVLGPADTVRFQGPCVLKAQIPEGGRGKRGLVLPVSSVKEGPHQLEILRRRLREQGFPQAFVLMEDWVAAQQACYLAWTVDDVGQGFALHFSVQGGVDVESCPEAIRTIRFPPSQAPVAHRFVDFFAEVGFTGRALGALCRFACATWRVFVHEDAQLLEINPLAVTAAGEVVALDAKIVLDDNAQPRHRDWVHLHSAELADGRATELERRAAQGGFTFIELEGEIAVLAGGAGIGMAILDALADAGMPAANFADASGGSGADMFESLGRITFERAARSDVSAILMYFTLAATSVASVVGGVLRLLDAVQPPKPLVVGLLASGAAERVMTFTQARQAFAARGLRCEPGLDEALRALAQARRDSFTPVKGAA